MLGGTEAEKLITRLSLLGRRQSMPGVDEADSMRIEYTEYTCFY